MEGNGLEGSDAIFYAEFLAAKVVEGVRDYPRASARERQAMIELVAAKLSAWVNAPEANHASE